MDVTAPTRPHGTEAAPATAASEQARGPFRLAVAALIAAIVTISLGGMTTSTGSGMAFLDWPLANGSLWPENMTLAGYFEHLHRAAAAVTGLLSIAIWWQTRRLASWVRWAAATLILIVSTQGVLGGLGVLKNLPWFTSISHGVLAQGTLAYLVVLCFVFSGAWAKRVEVDAGRRRTAIRLVGWTLGCMSVQLLMGAIARHTGSMHAVWGHVGFALIVASIGGIAGAYVSGRFKDVPGVRAAARLVNWTLLLQLVLGFAALAVRMDKHPENIRFLWRCALRTSHVLVGALLLSAAVYMGCRVVRTLVARSSGERLGGQGTS